MCIRDSLTVANTTISSSKHRLAVEQVSVVGYNGTTGALPIANSTEFFIKIRKNDNDAANRSQPMSLFAGPVKTTATATQIDLANALVKNGIANFRDEPANHYLTFSALSSNAGTAVTGTAVSLVWTKGSRQVTSAAVNKTITNVVAGTFVKVATATTTSVYKVKSFVQGTATTKAIITLDYAFQEESATVARATNMMITKTLAEAGTAGVRMTGVEANFDVNAFRDYYVNRFSVAFSDVSTLVTTTGAQTGSGVWQQVAMDEYMSYGFEGENGMLGVPPRFRDQTVIEDGKYGCIEISWADTIQGLVSLQGGKGSVLFYVSLASNGSLGAASTGSKLVTVLGKAAADVQPIP